MKTAADLFVIEVHEEHRSGRGRWWRPHRCGYTDLVYLAGVYDKAEAARIVDRSDRAHAVPVAKAIAELEAEIAEAQGCLGELLWEALGHTTGNTAQSEGATPGLTMRERRDRRGALTGRDEAPAVFPVTTPEEHERAWSLIEEHEGADPASHAGQFVTTMIARCGAYEARRDGREDDS